MQEEFLEEDFSPDELIEICNKKPLSECSKDFTYFGTPVDENDHESISEWSYYYALQKYNIGDQITYSQLIEDINDGVVQQTLDSLYEKGELQVLFDGKDFLYKLND